MSIEIARISRGGSPSSGGGAELERAPGRKTDELEIAGSSRAVDLRVAP